MIYPKKTIHELNALIEDGIFVISVTLAGVVEGQNWWFPSSAAKKIVKDGSSSGNGPGCFEYIFHLIRRCAQFFLFGCI